MTPTTPQSGRPSRIGELALWSTAGMVVLTAHIAAAAVLLRQEPAPAADQGPPAAIMIELAAVPEAANTEEDEVSEEQVNSEVIVSKQAEPVEEPLPEPIPEPLPEPVEPPPPEEVVEPVEPEPVEPPPVEEPEIVEETPEPPPEPDVDPLEQQMLAALENVEVPLPVMRPPPPAPKKDPPRKVQAKQQPQASKAAREAKLQAKQSERAAASKTSEGKSAPSVSPAKWQSRLMAHIRRRQRYPSSARANGETGTPQVRFRIDNGGNVISVSLIRSSGSATLDDAAVALIHRSSPVPAPPAGVSNTITAPIEYVLR